MKPLGSVIPQMTLIKGGRKKQPQVFVCKTCEDLGIVSRNVPINHRDFGKSFPCDDCEEGAALKAKTFERILSSSGLKKEYLECSLGSFDALGITEGKEMARMVAEAAISFDCQPFSLQDMTGKPDGDDTKRPGAIFSGEYGTGKTGLMACVANAFFASGKSVLWITAPSLWRAVKSTYSANSDITELEIFTRLVAADAVFLDDMGYRQSDHEKDTATIAEIKFFTDLIRAIEGMLFITTNCSWNEFWDEWRPRLSEVAFMLHRVNVRGVSLREYSQELG